MAEKEYIDREAVNALIKAECSPKVAAYLIDAVATVPAADVRPVVRARWIDTDNYYQRWKCSACGCHTRDAAPDFCPNCGARMVNADA